jgi:hypothetical protein
VNTTPGNWDFKFLANHELEVDDYLLYKTPREGLSPVIMRNPTQ